MYPHVSFYLVVYTALTDSLNHLAVVFCATCWCVTHVTCYVTCCRVIHLQGEHYRNTSETHAQMACMPLLQCFVLIQAGTSHATNWSSPRNTTSGVRPVVLLGAETRGSTMEQQWCAPITDVLLPRSTGSAPDTRLIWQMLRRKVKGQRESRHTHLTLPPYRHAAPSSTAPKNLSGMDDKKNRWRISVCFCCR